MTRRTAAAATLSLALHAAAFWLMLPHHARRSTPEQPPTIEVEMVDQAEQQRGAPATPAAPPPAPSIPEPPPGTGDLPTPPPPMPPPPTPPAQAAPGRPAVNLGGGDRDQDSLLVTGDNVVPPRPDAAVRNRPPSYPADAARRGAHGTVRLVIHVTESGIPAGIGIAASSGDPSLDRAALEAVALWRFQPARDRGVPVPFDYSLDITFRR